MITVVGDIIVDEYVHIVATKDNPEASPGEVWQTSTEKDWRLGGAGAVAGMISDLGEEVQISGVVGNDVWGHWALGALNSRRVHNWGCRVEADQCTTVKTRVVKDGIIQPIRFDREQHADSMPLIDDLLESELGDLLIISDYGKGCLTHGSIRELMGHAADQGTTVLVDPARIRSWSAYAGQALGLIKANNNEADGEYERTECFSRIARDLAREHGCDVVVTVGKYGMWHCQPGGDPCLVDAVECGLVDVCGAGDTVMACLAVAQSRGLSLHEGCKMAAAMAAQQVESLGLRPLQIVEGAAVASTS